MYHHESGAAKRHKTNDRKNRTESVLAKTRKLTTWLQKRESDTESLVTDEVEIRVEGEENTQDLARQSEQNVLELLTTVQIVKKLMQSLKLMKSA